MCAPPNCYLYESMQYAYLRLQPMSSTCKEYLMMYEHKHRCEFYICMRGILILSSACPTTVHKFVHVDLFSHISASGMNYKYNVCAYFRFKIYLSLTHTCRKRNWNEYGMRMYCVIYHDTTLKHWFASSINKFILARLGYFWHNCVLVIFKDMHYTRI